MIYWQNIFHQPVKNNLRTYDSIWKIAMGWGNNYTTSWLLVYNYFKDFYKMVVIDLSIEQALDVDPKPIQQKKFYEKPSSRRKCRYNDILMT